MSFFSIKKQFRLEQNKEYTSATFTSVLRAELDGRGFASTVINDGLWFHRKVPYSSERPTVKIEAFKVVRSGKCLFDSTHLEEGVKVSVSVAYLFVVAVLFGSILFMVLNRLLEPLWLIPICLVTSSLIVLIGILVITEWIHSFYHSFCRKL